MLHKGILAALLLVAAVLVVSFLCICLICWRRWHISKFQVCEPPNLHQSLLQPLIGEVHPNIPACESFRTPDEAQQSPTLAFETGQTLKRSVFLKLQREDSFQRFRAYQDAGADEVSSERRQALPCAERPLALWDVECKPCIGSTISLEVISGQAQGTHVSYPSGQLITIGRGSVNNLVVNDPEVSGKHACINWNLQKAVWELKDLGSLNGTLLNNQPISLEHSNNFTVRKPGIAFELETGDIVSLGSTSQLLVRIMNDTNGSILEIGIAPFQVGVAADAMSVRRGGRRLPMEDVCFYEWPLRGLQQIGVFCLFDGHGGIAAAQAASKMMPEKLSEILQIESKWSNVVDNLDASEVLRDAFNATEDALDHEYEGCTATILLVWLDSQRALYAQCANVGDSACIFSIRGKNVTLTEDHRLTNLCERSRLVEMGQPLPEGETRLCGMNIARVLGDKFLKEQDPRFSSEPFISDVLQITEDSQALAVMASDGLWDVLSQRRALQLALEAREGQHIVEGTKLQPLSAKDIAEMLVSKACSLRTKDNTSVIILNFVVGSKKSITK